MSKTPVGRIGSLDAIRGLALCGIAFVNVPAIWTLQIDPDLGPNHVRDLLDMFVQQRFFPIFSLLFGIGFGLMWASARTRAARPRVVMLRRFAFLFVLGVGHWLLQPGEALTPYAVCAMLVLLPATFLPIRVLPPVAAVAGGLLLGVALALDGGIITIPGLFLLGFALALYDVPRILDGNATLNAIILVIAAPLASVALWWQNLDPMAAGFSASSAVAGALLAVTYMALLGFLMSTPLRPAVLAVFAPMGRMSLTNYIGATLLFWAVKDALPLFGVADDSAASWSAAMAVVAGILAAQWMFSVAWLGLFRQGPLEWLWRTATWAGAAPTAAQPTAANSAEQAPGERVPARDQQSPDEQAPDERVPAGG
ncbi:DUF418 domain-containing protein [Corynebacterium sp. NPDC060344]|uniref:DUF418 domain-containing protein n=1 Tax=Corynebacterium sp. NPDC060344 TaxID=3347101 RepID=UPI0036589A1B